MTGWNPLTSAASGASFAGLLAALVIAVSIQIAFQASNNRSDQSMSLKAATPTLVTLMVASYLYIVLDGIPSTSGEVADALGPKVAALLADSETSFDGQEQILAAVEDYAQLAARGFAMAGTVLALGALMTLFIVVAAVFDNTSLPNSAAPSGHGPAQQLTGAEAEARVWALAVLRVAAAVLVAVLLLGYQVGASAAGRGVGWAWWLAHSVALGLPLVLVWFRGVLPLSVKQPVYACLNWSRRSARALVAVTLLAGVPAVAVLSVITAGRAHANDISLNGISFASGIYYGLAAAVLVLALERRAAVRVPALGATAVTGDTCPVSGDWEVVGVEPIKIAATAGGQMPAHQGHRTVWRLTRYT
ncbi:MAG: hypothetical protein M3P93_12640 [Actinomycetota bacterium]|nr:hypothetical protein [Actinomycetota bacterium]